MLYYTFLKQEQWPSEEVFCQHAGRVVGREANLRVLHWGIKYQ